MRRLVGTLVVTLVVVALALIMGCGSTGNDPSESAAGKPQPPPAPVYTVTDMGASVSWGIMTPNAINDAGQVAGSIGNGTVGSPCAWVWDGTPKGLPRLPNGEGGRASPGSGEGINSHGDVSGSAQGPKPGGWTLHPVIWVVDSSAPDGSGYTAFDLALGEAGATGKVTAINTAHEAVGRQGFEYADDGCVWTPTYGEDPNTPTGFVRTVATGFGLRDINDNYQAGGGPGVWTVEPEVDPTSWIGSLIPVPSGAASATVWTVNDDGDAAGYLTNSDGKNGGAFVWLRETGTTVNAGMLAGCASMAVLGINRDHVIVGRASTIPDRKGLSTSKGYVGKPVLTGGAITSYQLQDLTTLAGIAVAEARAINNNGWIACQSTSSTGYRPLLLQPK